MKTLWSFKETGGGNRWIQPLRITLVESILAPSYSVGFLFELLASTICVNSKLFVRLCTGYHQQTIDFHSVIAPQRPQIAGECSLKHSTGVHFGSVFFAMWLRLHKLCFGTNSLGILVFSTFVSLITCFVCWLMWSRLKVLIYVSITYDPPEKVMGPRDPLRMKSLTK